MADTTITLNPAQLSALRSALSEQMGSLELQIIEAESGCRDALAREFEATAELMGLTGKQGKVTSINCGNGWTFEVRAMGCLFVVFSENDADAMDFLASDRLDPWTREVTFESYADAVEWVDTVGADRK